MPSWTRRETPEDQARLAAGVPSPSTGGRGRWPDRSGPTPRGSGTLPVTLSGSDAFLQGHVVATGDALLDVIVAVNGQGRRLASPREPADCEGPMVDGRIAWKAMFLASELPAGDLTFEATAVDGRGSSSASSPSSSPSWSGARPHRILGYLESPKEGAVINGGVVEIAGWAINGMDVDVIEILLDGCEVLKAIPFFHVRRDLVERSGTGSNLFCGFWDLVDLDGRPEGSTCSLSVDAVGRSGRTHLWEQDRHRGSRAATSQR